MMPTMRTLETPPRAVVGADGSPAFGSFSGPLPHVDLAPLRVSMLRRIAMRKRWVYVAIANREVFVGLAIVDLGYATKTFAFVYRDGTLLSDRTALGPSTAGMVSDTIADGAHARFSREGAFAELRRQGGLIDVQAKFPGLSLQARLDARTNRPPLSAVGPIPGGVLNTTEKQALLTVTGEARVAGARIPLDDAFGGYDYTHGLLARHTRWKWAYLLGNATDGTRVGMNLVEGFLGERECGVWLDDALHPVGEGIFSFDEKRPLAPWNIRTTCGNVDLAFTPHAMHAEEENLVVVKSHFVQPIGKYRGTLRVGGRAVTLDGVLGVAEDQDVLW